MRASIERTYRETVESNPNKYKGIPMLCAKGLHETLEEKVLRYLTPGQRVLDLGCGRGALSLRLHDAALCVDAVDLFDLCMCRDQVQFTCMSIEEYLDQSDHLYDAIFMIEVIEHLENPYAILRKCHKILKKDGLLFVSTPNIDSDFSRTWFFLKGRHWLFAEENIDNDGHINPFHRFQMEYILEELKMGVAEKFTVGETGHIGSWRFKALRLILRLYSRLKGIEPKEGLVHGLIARKN